MQRWWGGRRRERLTQNTAGLHLPKARQIVRESGKDHTYLTIHDAHVKQARRQIFTFFLKYPKPLASHNVRVI